MRNTWFVLVQDVTIGGQVIIVLKGGEAFHTAPLDAAQWGWSIFFGILTIPIGALIRTLPDRVVLAASRKLRPLAWPMTRVVRWSRQRKLVKKLEKEMVEAEADLSDEPDEERRVHRMRWHWVKDGKKANPDQVLPTSNKTDAASPINTVAVQMGLATAGIRPLTQQPNQVVETAVVEGSSSTLTRMDVNQDHEESTRRMIESLLSKLEIHPESLKEDLIVSQNSSSNNPPSQDPEILRFMGFSKQ